MKFDCVFNNITKKLILIDLIYAYLSVAIRESNTIYFLFIVMLLFMEFKKQLSQQIQIAHLKCFFMLNLSMRIHGSYKCDAVLIKNITVSCGATQKII